jgi:hypothetical protein
MQHTDGITAFIISYCKHPSDLYGTLLTFDTLKIGFPHARLLVFDNASHQDARPRIRERVTDLGGKYTQIDVEQYHSALIRRLIWAAAKPNRPVVFLDPDLVFWEQFRIPKRDYLLAGRLIPQFYDEYANTLTLPRLHTSLLLVPDPRAFVARVQQLERSAVGLDLVRTVTIVRDGVFTRYDTLASFYAACPHECHAFGDEQLNTYDHLFCGTHLSVVAPHLNDDGMLTRVHTAAQTNVPALKGIWKQQDEFFRRRRMPIGRVGCVGSCGNDRPSHDVAREKA